MQAASARVCKMLVPESVAFPSNPHRIIWVRELHSSACMLGKDVLTKSPQASLSRIHSLGASVLHACKLLQACTSEHANKCVLHTGRYQVDHKISLVYSTASIKEGGWMPTSEASQSDLLSCVYSDFAQEKRGKD